MSAEQKLAEMGIELEMVAMESGRLMQAVRVGDLVYTSGQVSSFGDDSIIGKVGVDVSVDDGYRAARLSALNCLQAVRSLVGSLDQVERVVKILGMVNTGPDFNDTPSVIHGASDLFREVFGENGKHARSAVGMQIPSDYAVEVEAIFLVKQEG